MSKMSWAVWAIIVMAVTVAMIVFFSRSTRADVACFPAQEDITNTIRNIEVIRIESERQTELLKEIRAGLRAKR